MARRGFVIMAAVLVTLGVFAISGSLPGRMNWAEPKSEVTVSEKTVNCGNEQIVMDIRIPIVSGFPDGELERALNDRVRAQVETARACAEAEADALWREAACDGFEPWPFVFYADYEVYSARGVLSMRVTTDLDNGGVGLPQTVYYNIDIAKGYRLTLGDLFKSEKYCGVVNAYIRSQIKDDERFLPEQFTGVSSHTSFYIEDGRLFIAFAKYEIASGMTGEPVFEIPPPLLNGWIKPAYSGLLL